MSSSDPLDHAVQQMLAGDEASFREVYRAVQPALFNYTCRFSAITRRSPAPSRATELLRDSLVKAHGRGLVPLFTAKTS